MPMHADTRSQPLASRMRPRDLSEFVGQSALLAPDKPLRRAIEAGHIHSMILWGPSGTGKTTLARLLTQYADLEFVTLSAVLAGVKEIRTAMEQAKQRRLEQQRGTLLFVDEVHRFNKAQQDAFLPHVEEGTVIFIGATTENPSFELNNALLSRARVYVLQALAVAELEDLLQRALYDEARGLAALKLHVTTDTINQLANAADGDARRALNLLEIASDLAPEIDGQRCIDESVLQAVLSAGSLRRFDKGGDAFYDQISALHKSVRGSAPDAALYWFARMLDGGCDPLYIARRVVRMASEDIGNADPRALTIALQAWEVQTRLGSPEGELALAQAIVYLACAAKSNAVYKAFQLAQADAKRSASFDVPLHLRNAPTHLMKNLNYGQAYRYAHDEPNAYAAGEQYFPAELGEQRYYVPVDRGLEIRIAEKLAWLREQDAQAKTGDNSND